jgi:hypothetical protein
VIRRTAAIILALSIFLGSGAIAFASAGSERAALKAADYIVGTQRDDGGFGAKASTVSETCIAITALKTAGVKLPKAKSGKTAVDYLKANAPALASTDKKVAVQNTQKISQLIVALKLAGEDPKKFAGTDWVKYLLDNQEKATGWFGIYDIDHMWAMLALKSAGETVDTNAVSWLKGRQNANGGYELDTSSQMGTDTNATALAIQALIGADVKPTDPSVKKAIEYLKTQQNADGGFPFVTPSDYGTDSDTSSTSWVLQALIAAGEDIESKYWVKTAITPMGFLMSMQNADGAFAYQKVVADDSQLCTAQAIPALMSKPFPIKLTPPPSLSEKLPQDKTTSNTGSLIIIGLVAIAALVGMALAGLLITRGREGRK